MEVKILVALIENGDAENVRGQQVRGELDAFERGVGRAGQGLGQRGLTRARKILEQDMPPAGQRRQQFARGAGWPWMTRAMLPVIFR